MSTREEQLALFEANEGLAYYTLRKYFPTLANDEEAKQDALFSLWKACINYGSKENTVKFSTYAGNLIINDIRTNHRNKSAKKRNPEENDLSLDYEFRNDKNDDISNMHDLIPTSEGNIIFGFDDIHELFNDLEIKIIKLRMDGFNNSEIAKKLGFSRQYISEIMNKIKPKLLDNIITI